jgi:hypothetical protein
MAMPKLESNSFFPSRQAEAYAKGVGPRQAGLSTAAREDAAVNPHPAARGDRAEISTGARDLVDLRASVDAGRATLADVPDVRAERVAAARERLESGFYQTAEVRLATAERLKGLLKSLDAL